jgi:hypothetical protein
MSTVYAVTRRLVSLPALLLRRDVSKDAEARRAHPPRPPDSGLHRVEHPQPGRRRSRPRRTGPTWKQFLTAQAEHIVAVDFLHVDTINLTRI